MRDAIIRKNASLVRTCLSCLSLCLPCISNGSPGVDICQEPIAESNLSIAYYDNEKTSFERNLGETNRDNFSTDLQFKMNDNWIFGVGHRSAILDVERLELQTNGYLHTFFVPVHRLDQSDNKSFRFSIAPALSASSNVTKDPNEYTADALQLLVALVWGEQISDRLGLSYGICGDHRFGEYQVYPVIGINWQPHADWLIELGFPASRLSYEVTKSLTSVLQIAPNGNEWYVKNKSLDKHSQFVYEAYLLEWALSWRAHQKIMLTASVGREFHSRYEMTLLNETRIRVSSDPTTRVGVSLAWFF
jgi:hypothetical protein